LKGLSLKFRTDRQEDYYAALCSKKLVFAYGPAGTGKTFLACCRAAELIRAKMARKIYLVRPAVVADEDIGYLPGDQDEKLDPYVLPLREQLAKAGFRGEAEVAPLAFMRGRTLEKCVVLVDEAQNITIDQMFMLLSRIGEGCFCFVMGDLEQLDLDGESGLEHAINVLPEAEKYVDVVQFHDEDIVRSKLVKEILRYW
jgi:phosphate starvation-inducible PhoH-like protein